MSNKTLCLITAEYPYGRGESFIENEIKILSQRFQKVYIFPLNKKSKEQRQILANVIVDDLFLQQNNTNQFNLFFSNFFYIIKLLFIELIYTNKKLFFLKNCKGSIGFLLLSLHKAQNFTNFLNRTKKESTTEFVFYSFWMDQGALMFSILKDKGIINQFFFRVLGYDLYDERRVGGYMPFRYFNFKHTKKIFCISKDGFNYLKNKNIFPEKHYLSYLSVFDNGINVVSNSPTFTLVSCSNLISLKRVHLIIEILKNVTIKLNWIHFGDGILKDELIAKCKQLPTNISVDFKGSVSNSEILNFYKNTAVNLFIHLSETEGGAPVALQEAASVGIPLIGTNAGGIPEIVTKETGVLIPIDFDINYISNVINNFQSSEMNTIEFRNGVRKYWYDNFNAEINYNKLCDELLS